MLVFLADPVVVLCDFSSPNYPVTTISPPHNRPLLKGPNDLNALSYNSAGEIINYYPYSVAQMKELIVSCHHIVLHILTICRSHMFYVEIRLEHGTNMIRKCKHGYRTVLRL